MYNIYKVGLEYGGVAKWLNAADCKSAPSGFGSSNLPPSTIIHIVLLGCSQAVRHRVLIPCNLGSNPSSPAIFLFLLLIEFLIHNKQKCKGQKKTSLTRAISSVGREPLTSSSMLLCAGCEESSYIV